MSDDLKMALAVVAALVVIAGMIMTCFIVAGKNAYELDLACLKSGNRIHYTLLEGKSEPVKECK